MEAQYPMMNSLSGKRVLVTGGAIRVGAVLVRAFAAAGAKVVIHCRNSRAEAEKLLAELGGEAAGHRIAVCDLTEPDAAEKLIAASGSPDILVNNASTFVRRRFAKETEEEILASLKINALAPITLMKAFAASLPDSVQDAAIVNIVDQAVAGTDPAQFGYLASKKMLADATETAALQYAPRIRVNAVAPGPMIAPPGLEHLQMRNTLTRVPLKRPADPEDVAQTVLFAASCRSMTGAILFVDGGQHLSGKNNMQGSQAE